MIKKIWYYHVLVTLLDQLSKEQPFCVCTPVWVANIKVWVTVATLKCESECCISLTTSYPTEFKLSVLVTHIYGNDYMHDLSPLPPQKKSIFKGKTLCISFLSKILGVGFFINTVKDLWNHMMITSIWWCACIASLLSVIMIHFQGDGGVRRRGRKKEKYIFPVWMWVDWTLLFLFLHGSKYIW